MASPFTRSSRRSEGLSTRSSTRNNVVITNPQGNHNSPANIGRKKRPRDESTAGHEEEHSIVKKKARIAIEIASRSKAQPKTRSLVIKENAVAKPAVAEKYSASQSPPPKSKHAAETATQTQPAPPTPPPEPVRKHTTNHHEKVVNGIKHELDRLQPSAADLKDEKRKLRSQEGTRFKSELSAYFPEYDEIIGNEPKEEREFPILARMVGVVADVLQMF